MASMVPPSPTSCSKSTIHCFCFSNFNASKGNAVPRMLSSFHLQQSCKSFRLAYTDQTRGRSHRNVLKPIRAAGSGLETSVKDAEGSTLKFRNIEIAVESREADKILLRVDLGGEDTRKAFDVILTNLSRSAPVLPGFRRQKGGKTSKIPKNLLIDILGKSYVMKFVLREIVTSAVGTYVKEENLTVKDNKITTTQTEDELYKSFLPGNGFGFNAEIELVNEQIETTEEIETSG